MLSPTSKASGDFIELFGKKIPVGKYARLEQLVSQYHELCSDELRAFKSEYTRSAINAESRRSEQASQQVRENRILELIIRQIMPALKEDPDFGGHADSAIGEVHARSSAAIGREAVGELRTQIHAQYENNALDVATLDNLLFLGTRYAHLDAETSSFCHVTLNNQHLFAGEPKPVSELKAKCMRFFEKQLKLEALEEDHSGLDAILQVRREREQLAATFAQSDYAEHGIGFERCEGGEGGYYVFATIKPYALISPFEPDLFYHGKKAKIGVLVSAHGRGFSVSRPKVLNQYKHPYLPHGGADQDICMGSYDYEKHRLSAADKAITLISDAKRKLRELYYGRGGPYHEISRDSSRYYNSAFLRDLHIDLQTVRRLNLPITNLALVKRERGERYGPRL